MDFLCIQCAKWFIIFIFETGWIGRFDIEKKGIFIYLQRECHSIIIIDGFATEFASEYFKRIYTKY